MKLTKSLFVSAVLFLSATGAQAAGFVQNGNYLTVQLKMGRSTDLIVIRYLLKS